MGFSSLEGNTQQWLKYLSVDQVRVFVQPMGGIGFSTYYQSDGTPTTSWRKIASNTYDPSREAAYGSQFGLAFDSTPVTTQDAYLAAVNEARSRFTAGGKDFRKVLLAHKAIAWDSMLTSLDKQNSSCVVCRQTGSPYNRVVPSIHNGLDVVAIYDLRCRNLAFEKTDPTDPGYWGERWEEYRLTYIGGWWLADAGVTSINIYNEPDKDDDCTDAVRWPDHLRIRSTALQHAYADYNQVAGTSLVPSLHAPTSAATFDPDFGSASLNSLHIPFPGTDPIDGFTSFQIYDFHDYGKFSGDGTCTVFGDGCNPAAGVATRNEYNKAKNKLASSGFATMPVSISEFNCFMAATADNTSSAYMLGTHVMDFPSTAACVASIVGNLLQSLDPPVYINMHKSVQNLTPNVASKWGKNGILWADTYNMPHAISGSTQAAEAYRLILKKCKSSKPIWGFDSSPYRVNDGSRVSIWAVQDGLAVYVYVTNETPNTHTMSIDLGTFGIDPYSYIVGSGVGVHPTLPSTTMHGEVVYVQQPGSTAFNYTHPGGSLMAFTVSKVPSLRLELEAIADVTLFADGTASRTDPTLRISTVDAPVAVTVLQFDTVGHVGTLGIVSAVLKLHLESTTASAPQVLSVFGLNEAWNEGSVSWSSLPQSLLPVSKPVASTSDNFVNWWGSPAPVLLGHMTVPPQSSLPSTSPGGVDLQLDVSDAIQNGVTNFLILKMWRYDVSQGDPPSQLPPEPVQGTHTFSSREAVLPSVRPKLFVHYQVSVYDSPPPPPPVRLFPFLFSVSVSRSRALSQWYTVLTYR